MGRRGRYGTCRPSMRIYAEFEPGEYRLVMEVDVSGLKQKLASGNTLIIAGEPETAIEVTTWGFIKAINVKSHPEGTCLILGSKVFFYNQGT